MKRPILTLVLIALAVAWTGWILLSPESGGDWRRFGISDGFHVFRGDYWTLITSMFAHVDVLHLLFNIYWMFVLGAYVEGRFGWRFLAVLVLISGFCASSLELSFAGSTGVGLSGVVYAIFGFLWGVKLFGKEVVDVLPKERVHLFLVWFVLCIGLTVSGAMSVGNVAHGTGLILGLLTAVGHYANRSAARIPVPMVVAFCGVALFYSPWCYPWLASRATRAQEAQQWYLAESYYSRMIERDPNDAWALENRGHIRIFRGREPEGKADLSSAQQAKQNRRTEKK